jgi:hypothetical protein
LRCAPRKFTVVAISLNPSNDGKSVRIPVPPLTPKSVANNSPTKLHDIAEIIAPVTKAE